MINRELLYNLKLHPTSSATHISYHPVYTRWHGATSAKLTQVPCKGKHEETLKYGIGLVFYKVAGGVSGYTLVLVQQVEHT